jgi:uncharacterized repeat protein (TIGR02543 family)
LDIDNTKRNKNSFGVTAIIIVLGVILAIGAGFLASKYLSKGNNSNSNYAEMSNNGQIEVMYNYNLFTANGYSNKTITAYNESLQILAFSGNLEGTAIPLGRLLNIKFAKGDKYKVTVNFTGGSYSSSTGNEPLFVMDLQKNERNYANRSFGKHYISGTLPATKEKSFSKELTIADDLVNSTNLYFWLWQKTSKATTFNNYRIQIFITKVNNKTVRADGVYGEMPTPEKDGYTFTGWYDNLSGNNKIEATTKIVKKNNHTLYAHWTKDSSSTPTTCESGYKLVNDNCVPNCNISNCTKCNTPDVCSKCSTGYSLRNGQCSKITCSISNCRECNATGNACTKCEDGYKLDNGNCTIVPSNCSDFSNCLVCSSEKCTKCKTGYVIHNGRCLDNCPTDYTATNGVCKPNCTINGCTNCSAPNKCTTCKDGYTLKNNACIKDVDCSTFANCMNCNAVKCTKCNNGYYLSNSRCVQSCPTNYHVSKGACVPDCNISNCSKCSEPNKCTTCSQGYKVSNNACVKECSIKGCATCKSKDVCSKCATGYTITKKGTCLPDCNIENCNNCSEPNVCQFCIGGYAKKGNECIYARFKCTLDNYKKLESECKSKGFNKVSSDECQKEYKIDLLICEKSRGMYAWVPYKGTMTTTSNCFYTPANQVKLSDCGFNTNGIRRIIACNGVKSVSGTFVCKY